MILRAEDLDNHRPSMELLQQLQRTMTPLDVLSRESFEPPKVIHPKRYLNFNSLLLNRAAISRLELVPVKSDAMQAHYHSFDREVLRAEVAKLVGSEVMLLAPNQFPYDLPADVEQHIVWFNQAEWELDIALKFDDRHRSRTEWAQARMTCFIAQVMVKLELDLDDIICFERPLGITTKLVRGSFPHYKHSHLWIRKHRGLPQA